ncbi:bifunctional lysylphosphatidylglycerol flippase/synthetase MprF [Enterococcus sp. LJL98]
MQRINQVFQKYVKVFQFIFFTSVVLIVVREFLLLNKSLSYRKLFEGLAQIAPWKVIVLFFAGVLAVLPMVGYDWVLNQTLKQKKEKKSLFQTSWMINTVNNVAGFGGLISIGLRSQYYGKNQTSKTMAQSLSKVLLFMMSGLSIYSLIGLGFLWLTDASNAVRHYWPWLLGGSLYFPLVLLLNLFLHQRTALKVNRKEQAALLLTSFLEWSGALGMFLFVGYMLGISYEVKILLPLFVASSVIGIISMIPGAFGSFDLIMLLSLTPLGLSKEVVASWLLLYRLFYYIFPFFITLPLFAYTTGTLLNTRYEGVPKRLWLELLHKLSFLGYYVFGLVLLLNPVLPEPFHFGGNVSFIPSVRLLHFLLGWFFLLAGRALAAKVKSSYLLALGLNVVTMLYFLVIGNQGILFFFLLYLSLITFSSRKELFRLQFIYAWEWLTVDMILVFSTFFLYTYFSVEAIGKRHPGIHQKNWHKLFAMTGKSWFFLFSFLLFLTLLSYLWIRCLQGEKRKLGQAFAAPIVEEILQNNGGNLNSSLAFLGDKRLFIYKKAEKATVFFQFGIENNKCIVMGDPSGNVDDFPAAVAALIEEADRLGYTVVFYEVSESMVFLLHEYGYDFFKMGEEAQVFLPTFTLSGKKMKGNRALVNKLTKEGLVFEVVQPPFSKEFLQELKEVSDAWLGSRKEKGFSLGFFSEDYLQRSEIAIVRKPDKTIVAFANIIPAYEQDVTTIDLMRHHPDKAPSGTMDYLFIHLFERSREQGLTFFSLGMAPLANVGVMRKSFIQERVAHLVYQFGSRFYSFQGLRRYKAKYASRWQPSYLLYHRETWILYVMLALLSVDGRRLDKQKTKEVRKSKRTLRP